MKAFACMIALCALSINGQDTASSTCEPYKSVRGGQYNVMNYIEEIYAPEGQQCVTVDSWDDTSVSWHANWTWSETRDWTFAAPFAQTSYEKTWIRDHESIPSTWEWSFEEGSDAKASASYYLWGDGGCMFMSSWVVSIWLQTVGDLVPIDKYGNHGDVVGTASVSGVTFTVHQIRDSSGVTFIFAAQEPQSSFDGDLLEFLNWPGANGLPSLGCVWGVQAGVDVFGGEETQFTTSKYSIQQNLS